ncbi:MAG: hypothetical protein GY870_00110 [archaeon]|nr:hypothetical protein [archaeon]
MKIKLWIIYKNGIGFSKMIAEMFQDRLEDFVDVSLGNAKKIDPSFIVEENVDYLIIGDVFSDGIPSVEIQNWLLKYRKVSDRNNLIVKAVSSFYIIPPTIKPEPSWIEYLQGNINAEMAYPPILLLKLNRAELALEKKALELINEYSNNLIKLFIENKKE